MTDPETGTCGRCRKKDRPLFAPSEEWGDNVPAWLCAHCWGAYADARANNTYLDFNDAFDHASDEELEERFGETGLEKTRP